MKQISLSKKIIMGCSLPIILTVMVSIFSIFGFNQIKQSNRLIKEKIIQAQSIEDNDEVIALLESSEKRVQVYTLQVIIITLIAITFCILISFFIARSIQIQSEKL